MSRYEEGAVAAAPTRAQSALVEEALAIEAESAREAGTLGYMARAMVQATMPHRRVENVHHVRTNGDYTLTMVATNPAIGLPYGAVPRLMLAWIGAETMRTGERELVLGESMSAFMAQLGMVPTGGRWGSITRLKDQSMRLFSCAIACSYMNESRLDTGPDPLRIGRAQLWWDTKRPEQGSLFRSTLTLSEAFHREIVEHPVPLDMRVLQALRKSPLALDVYSWTVYRIHTLNRSGRPSTTVPWEALRLQFGAGYADGPQGMRDFRKAFLRELVKVRTFYPEALIGEVVSGLRLERSPEHLPQRPRRSTGSCG